MLAILVSATHVARCGLSGLKGLSGMKKTTTRYARVRAVTPRTTTMKRVVKGLCLG
jgi:hypothetical protein